MHTSKVLIFTCLVVAAFALPQFSKEHLSINLEDMGNGQVRFSITNNGDLPARVLSYGLPLEGLFADMFSISDEEGRKVRYSGPIARRIMPAPADAFVTLLAHNTIHITVDLKEAYAFPSSGVYQVAMRLDDHESLSAALFPEGELSVFVHTIQAQSEENQSAMAGTFENCSNTEESQTTTAISGAISNSQKAYNCMSKKTCNSLVDTWFGAISQSTYDYDQDMFQRINQYFSADTPNYHCNPVGCPNNVYAYVYPTDPSMTIYLCGAFWSQANERVNTLVHEESHFNAVGGTQDYVYGRPGCLALAQSNPLQASHNADNVCYFADDA